MEKKELGREDVIEALKKIAFGRVNRGVELTYLSEPTAQLIRKMDLSAVAEFKRNANGTVEVKFVDRVKALSALYDMLGGGGRGRGGGVLAGAGAGGRGERRLAAVKQFSAKQKTAMTWWANPKVPRVRRDHLRRGGAKREDAVDGDGLFPVGDAAL